MNTLLLDEMESYLEDLAVKNTNIQHTIDGRQCFASFQTDEQIDQIVQNGGENIVVIADYYGGRVGEYDDKKARQFIKVRFACKANTAADLPSSIRNAFKLAEEIMLDFQSKMAKDFEDDDCSVLQYVEFEKMNWKAFEGPWLDSFYGFDLDIPFKTYMPAYNAAKWNI